MNNIISALIGVLISVMILFNGTLSNVFGNYVSGTIIHIVGLICVLFILLITKSRLKIKKGIPLYLYSAGAIGVFTVLFTNISFSLLGVSIPVALGLLGQSIASIIIDHFGLLGMNKIKFHKRKYIGLVLIIIGVIFMAIF
jgi:bacterial/archaeal transporter family-2 protein